MQTTRLLNSMGFIKSDGQTDGRRDRQKDRQTDRYTDRHTDRQTDMTENITYPHTRVVITIFKLKVQYDTEKKTMS